MTTQHTLHTTLEQLCQSQYEGTTVEFKSNLDQAEDIGAYISALANSAALDGHECAWMVWGVADGTHRITGTQFDPLTRKIGNQSLVMWLQHKTQPRADFSFHTCHHPNGLVVMLKIHPAHSAPIAFDGIRYIRIDSHKTKLSDHPGKEARLWVQLGQQGDWSGEVIPSATLDDLDPEAVASARQRFTEYLLKNEPDSSRHAQLTQSAAAWDTPTLLNKAHITKQGRITRSALLLLGRDEASHLLAPADTKITWILRDANNQTVSSRHLGLPMLLATEQAFRCIRNVTVEHLPDGTLFPVAMQRYDNWVIREALHNCVAHQDYRLGGKINLVEHPDRLVFSNLGQFIPPSVEWMLEHQSPPEHYRNQWLIDGMIRLRMIDQVGSGIRRMFQTQRERYFPLPDYAFNTIGAEHPRVEMTLSGKVLDINYTQVLMRRDDLSLQQVIWLDRVQKHLPLPPQAIRTLKTLKLIEGRSPNCFISAQVAHWTDQKASYIRNRGLNDHYYQHLVLEYIKQYGQANRKEIEELLLSKLPEVLDTTQKSNKIRNLLQAMRRDHLIQPKGPRSATLWQLTDMGLSKLG